MSGDPDTKPGFNENPNFPVPVQEETEMRHRKNGWRVVLVVMAFALLVAACSSDDGAATTTAGDAADTTDTTEAAATETTTNAGTTETTAAATGTPVDAPGFNTWEEVLAAADGTTVNWFMWGGSDTINTNVDDDIGAVVKELFNITLNRVPADAADFVNQVLDESAAGVTEGGSIDLMWINGENFATLKQADLMYGPWAESIPNAVHVPWQDPSIANDFGEPVLGLESPWGHAQFVVEYDTAFVAEAPTTFEALQTWVHENPGQFSYPAIPDFVGSVFVRHLFYWAAGGPEAFLGEFDQAVYDEYAPAVWAYLNDIEPDLWRGGDTYPEGAAMADLMANQEIHFNMSYDPSRASTNIAAGTYPESIRTFVFDTGTLSNNNYVGIPFNAANPAGAMVVADYIVSPEFQLVMADPDQWGWLIPTDSTTWTADQQATLASYGSGVATLPLVELAKAALPEPDGDWVTAFEAGWIENVLEK
jgi:putative spermidine/putrescine transport system substrate-binding protein